VLSKRPISTDEGVLSPVSESPPSKVSVLNIHVCVCVCVSAELLVVACWLMYYMF
jgi:hypothetical protein